MIGFTPNKDYSLACCFQYKETSLASQLFCIKYSWPANICPHLFMFAGSGVVKNIDCGDIIRAITVDYSRNVDYRLRSLIVYNRINDS